MKKKTDQANKNMSKVSSKKKNTNGLPEDLKYGIESLSGYSLDDVKAHYNSKKPDKLNTQAFARGSTIHLAPAQEKHLPHETWEVVQQKKGWSKNKKNK